MLIKWIEKSHRLGPISLHLGLNMIGLIFTIVEEYRTTKSYTLIFTRFSWQNSAVKFLYR